MLITFRLCSQLAVSQFEIHLGSAFSLPFHMGLNDTFLLHSLFIRWKYTNELETSSI